MTLFFTKYDAAGNGGASLERSRSAANIMTRAMKYFSRSSSVTTAANGHTAPPEDFSFSEADEVPTLQMKKKSCPLN